MKDEFHNKYANAIFMDDTPWLVWQDAWNACLDNTITTIHKRVLELLEQKKDEEALELQLIMNQILETKSK